jgi:hypothetical protein
MKKLLIIAIIALGVSFSACQKDNPVLPNQSEMTTITPPPDQGGDTTIDQIKASWILNATSASQIPSQFFKVATMYKNSYIHMGQYSGECSWTSYALCAGTIARANGYSYAATHTKVTAIKNACVSRTNSTSDPYDTPADISVISWYCGANDYSIISKQLKATPQSTGRFEITKYMLNHIYTYHTPFLALATDPNSGIGHYLTVWSIDWKVGGTGSTVYYTNTLLPAASTFDGNVKSTSLTTFLNWMYDNPTANYYNCLFLWN